MKQTGTTRKGRFDLLPSKSENEVICKSEIAVLGSVLIKKNTKYSISEYLGTKTTIKSNRLHKKK